MNTKVYITYYKEYTTSDTEAEREELKTLRRSLEAQLETAENAKVQDESDIESRLDIARDRLKEIGKTLRGANKTRQAVTHNRPVPSHYGTFRSITKNF